MTAGAMRDTDLPHRRPARRRPGGAGAAAFAVALGGCGGVQSALAPRGGSAAAIADLGAVMLVGAVLVLLLVVGLTAAAMLWPAERRRRLGRTSLVLWGGIVLPVVALTALLVAGLGLMRQAVEPPARPPLHIEVIGERWWWRVRYLDAEGDTDFVTANEIRLPVGQPVEFRLASAGLIHSFWVPQLGGKLDMIPGRTNRLVLSADAAGTFRGQCAEYCGAAHAQMAFEVVAEPPQAFADWAAAQRRPAAKAAAAEAQRGAALFLASGCGACHTVRGTPAAGTVGPDLTHVGGRLTIAAGTLPRNAGTLAAWILDAQHVKPGNLMPSFDILAGDEARAIAVYLDGLK